ncbi:DUF2550 domain-containing protein [Nocardioides caldifontis]|uniref:DUF2550 domain-containing protein n=1 Tax=Nocardioides caldifontis TaxID=2588938 RepID=UPI0011DF8D8D|nr:DUF2550 domain-containing protein [Nocardioides caldifontis]
MPLWQWVVDGVGAVLLLLLLYGVVLVVRRRLVGRNGGTFELSYRPAAGPAGAAQPPSGRGWVLGMGRYSADRLEFFRIFSVAPRPSVVLGRADLSYVGQRSPAPEEAHSLYAGHVVAEFTTRDGRLELAMTPGALTGLLAWLEAAPPGRRPPAV